jgi:putative transposase
MARPLRIQFPGAVYHVTARGNERKIIFADDVDCRCFLSTLRQAMERHHVSCHAYCLMGNHYHLLLETPEGNLSRAMQHLNNVYAQRFNRRHDRVGHLFQGRFDAQLIEKQRYLLAVLRYIANNPVRAGLVAKPEQWRWSNYRFMIRPSPSASVWTTEWALRQFHTGSQLEAVRRFRAFVEADPAEDGEVGENSKGRPILGSEDFVSRLRKGLRAAASEREFPRQQRFAARPSLQELLPEFSDRNERNVAIRKACLDHGYTMSEVAAHLGLHYITIHRAMKRSGVRM